MKYSVNLQTLVTDEEGATMVEYAIMVGFIAAVCAASVALIGPVVAEMFDSVIPGFQ